MPPVDDKNPQDDPPVDDKILQEVPPAHDEIPQDVPPAHDEIPQDVPPVHDEIPRVVSPVDEKIPQDVPQVDDKILQDIPPVDDEIPQDVPPVDDKIPQDVPPVEDKISQDVPPVDDNISQDIPPVDENIPQDVPSVEDKITHDVLPIDDKIPQYVYPDGDKIAQDDPSVDEKIAKDIFVEQITEDVLSVDRKMSEDTNIHIDQLTEDVLSVVDKITEGVHGDENDIDVVVERITGDDQKSEDVPVVHATEEEKDNIIIESITPTLAQDMEEIETDNAELATKVDIAEEYEETEETGGKTVILKKFINQENEEAETDENCDSVDLENGKECSEPNIKDEIKDQANIQDIDIEKVETSERADANAEGTIEEKYGGETENDELSNQNLISSDIQQKNCPDLLDPIWKHKWNLACLDGDQQNHGALSDVRDIIADIVCTATAGNVIREEEPIKYLPNNEVNSDGVFEPSEKDIESLNSTEVEKLEEKFEETSEIDGLKNGKVEEKEDTSKGTRQDIKDDKDSEENSEKLEVAPEMITNFSTEIVESDEKRSEHDTGDGIFITENIEDLDVNVAEVVQTMDDGTREGIEEIQVE